MALRVRDGGKARDTDSLSKKLATLLLAFLALVLHLLGNREHITVLQGGALVLGIWTSVFWLGGTAALRAYIWPLSYLLLLVPIPTFFMAQLTLGMRELSTTLAAWVLQGVMAAMQLPFARVGNQLHFGSHTVTIVDACSGMNTLLSVIATGLLLAYLEKSRLRAWLTGAMLVPAAILANLFRILLICLLVSLGQSAWAFGPGHDWIGVGTVGLALVVLAFGIWVPKKWENSWNTPKRSKEAAHPFGWYPEPWRWPSLTGVLVLAAALTLLLPGSPPLADNGHTTSLPQGISSQVAGWTTTELPLDPSTFDIVGTRNAHMLKFEQPNHPPIFLYYLSAADSRKIGHPPELCFKADGYEVLERRSSAIHLPARDIPAIRLQVRRGDYQLLVFYWYQIGGVPTASYLGQQWSWLWTHLKGLTHTSESREASLVRISTKIEGSLPEPAAVAAAEQRLMAWLKAIP